MVIQVIDESLKTDTNGKKYKYLTLYSPEYTEVSRKTNLLTVRPSKTCGYIAYPVDYTEHQGSDPGASLCKGDEVEGYILTVRVKPYWVGKDFLTRCTVPVFCSKEDPVEFEIAMEKAIIRAGKEIDPKELEYGGIEQQLKVKPEIPKNCLVVKTIKQF